MKKNLFLPIITCLILTMSFLTVLAEDVERPAVVKDDAGILSATEAETLSQTLENCSKRVDATILVATIQSKGSQESVDIAENMYKDYMKEMHGSYSSQDGVLLLLCMDESDWAVYADGFCKTAINSSAMTVLMENVLPELSSKNYATALSNYGESAVSLISQARNGKAYKEPFSFVKHLVIALVIGLIVAFIATGSMKGELNSVHKQNAASNYIKQNSLKVTQSKELYLYKKLDKTQKANANNGATANSAGKSASGKF